MKQEYQRLEQKCADIRKEIQTLPEGKLLLCSNGSNKISWFKSNGPTKEYIKKKDIKLAQKLSYKRFLNIQLENNTHEMRAIKFYLDHHQDNSKSGRGIEESSEFQKLLSVNFTPLKQETKEYPLSMKTKEKLVEEYFL